MYNIYIFMYNTSWCLFAHNNHSISMKLHQRYNINSHFNKNI